MLIIILHREKRPRLDTCIIPNIPSHISPQLVQNLKGKNGSLMRKTLSKRNFSPNFYLIFLKDHDVEVRKLRLLKYRQYT